MATLRGPVSSLLGITPDAASALRALEIVTVFDLATSSAFVAATTIFEAASNTRSLLNQHGQPPPDLVRESVTAAKSITQLRDLPIGALQAIPENQSATIAKALSIDAVRELALYPPYRAATKIPNFAYFPDNEPDFNAEQPADLLPKSGEYPTEKVQYTSLVMDEIQQDPNDTSKIDIAGNSFAPLDLSKLAAGDTGFSRIAYGALITMSQSWFAHGVSLGRLLHSVSLAPGEVTRIAIVDWSRKSKAGQSEVVKEEDDLDSRLLVGRHR